MNVPLNEGQQTAWSFIIVNCSLSADNFYKQFGSRSGPILSGLRSGSKLFDTLMVFLKDLFWKKLILKANKYYFMHAKLANLNRCKKHSRAKHTSSRNFLRKRMLRRNT